MTVRTTADEQIDKAKEHIQEALECLSEVIVAGCYGTSDYTQLYLEKLERQFVALLGIKRSLE
jgi:predicted house-cleaning NTP pyrophosphatase (Maf/HAM1 superfamily)